jgi:HTH-type transcriptional regulator/antitoxin HipB
MTITSVKDIAVLVKQARLKLGMTQAQAAALCNVGTRFLSDLENAKPTLQIDKVIKVTQMFGITLTATINSEQTKSGV